MGQKLKVGLKYMRDIGGNRTITLDATKQTSLENIKMGKKQVFGKYKIIMTKCIQIVSFNRGGGSYEDGLKSGEWIEIHDNFQDNFKIIIEGEYDMGKKAGTWTSKIRQPSSQQQSIIIGGGNYNDGLKTGEWTELDQNYEKQWNFTKGKNQLNHLLRNISRREKSLNLGYKNKQYQNVSNLLIQVGEAHIYIQVKKMENGLSQMIILESIISYSQIVESLLSHQQRRVLKWEESWKLRNLIKRGNQEIQLNDREDVFLMSYKFRGGGEYDDQGSQTKKWIELYQNFWKQSVLINNRDCRVIFQGKYQDGKKEGKWESLFQSDSNHDYALFGGGLYNRGLKHGPWIEFQEKITLSPQQHLIVSKYDNGKGINQKQHQ
ncbi:unnamed protein product (macronuclear) [Paramecium tetraurelia]|uniref:Jacalin-type lectin domain-containing protein n=1 Tax=Paramecium tetraurelia TaxID=5888 RepID=A0CBA2_PARTE|nr:uncharacterized protein GSPATT00036852001 [Paramecium tetraurelia]CAK68069.1 unnamed protein product [Paramecium tetraurelia]|eukprot:XP_001435466.1 hypothetical protein (macronuclear) [Paramecium tetraurelia strain d4-2]